ncbi:MAG: hypothetical protein Tsb0021_02850 [Chlamydiales bacterium]
MPHQKNKFSLLFSKILSSLRQGEHKSSVHNSLLNRIKRKFRGESENTYHDIKELLGQVTIPEKEKFKEVLKQFLKHPQAKELKDHLKAVKRIKQELINSMENEHEFITNYTELKKISFKIKDLITDISLAEDYIYNNKQNLEVVLFKLLIESCIAQNEQIINNYSTIILSEHKGDSPNEMTNIQTRHHNHIQELRQAVFLEKNLPNGKKEALSIPALSEYKKRDEFNHVLERSVWKNVRIDEENQRFTGELIIGLGTIDKSGRFINSEFSIHADVKNYKENLEPLIDDWATKDTQVLIKLSQALTSLYNPSMHFEGIRHLTREQMLVEEILRIDDGLAHHYLAASKAKDLTILLDLIEKDIGGDIRHAVEKFLRFKKIPSQKDKIQSKIELALILTEFAQYPQLNTALIRELSNIDEEVAILFGALNQENSSTLHALLKALGTSKNLTRIAQMERTLPHSSLNQQAINVINKMKIILLTT